MEPEYWQKRWREGRIGWHHEAVMPLLEKHWPARDVPRGTRVLVPLCGKSLDMLWLSQQGLHVFGVDVSPIAIESFVAENHLHARTHDEAGGRRYEIAGASDNGSIEIVNGDVFDVDESAIARCNAFYDRAALIAMPAPMRRRLADEVYVQLPAGSAGLIITLDYPEGEMEGPPFSVDDAEVHRLFDRQWNIERLERRDILASQPSFSEKGVTALHTAVYALTRRAVRLPSRT
jgi:thiopurine S-methyltransferase